MQGFTAVFTVLRLLTQLKMAYEAMKTRAEPYRKIVEELPVMVETWQPYGEEIGAYVQLEEGASLTVDAIIRACRERLPFSKTPKVVLFGEELPS